MDAEPKYWFPAKRYGWGWGLPNCWQGWLVLGAFVALMVIGALVLPPKTQLAAYLAYVVILCGLLTGICWLTGEPARWRRGDDERG